MDGILSVLSVAGLFLLRVGVPVVVLVLVGILIDRWQSKRDAEIQRQIKPDTELTPIEDEEESESADEEAGRRAA